MSITDLNDDPAQKPAAETPQPTLAKCLRCGAMADLDETGFCERCLAEMEKACL